MQQYSSTCYFFHILQPLKSIYIKIWEKKTVKNTGVTLVFIFYFLNVHFHKEWSIKNIIWYFHRKSAHFYWQCLSFTNLNNVSVFKNILCVWDFPQYMSLYSFHKSYLVHIKKNDITMSNFIKIQESKGEPLNWWHSFFYVAFNFTVYHV